MLQLIFEAKENIIQSMREWLKPISIALAVTGALAPSLPSRGIVDAAIGNNDILRAADGCQGPGHHTITLQAESDGIPPLAPIARWATVVFDPFAFRSFEIAFDPTKPEGVTFVDFIPGITEGNKVSIRNSRPLEFWVLSVPANSADVTLNTPQTATLDRVRVEPCWCSDVPFQLDPNAILIPPPGVPRLPLSSSH